MKRFLGYGAALAATFLSLVLVALLAITLVRCRRTSYHLGKAVAMGRFHPVAHAGSGVATIYEQADGTYALELRGLQTERRVDLKLYLISAPDAPDNETVQNARRLELGSVTASNFYQLPLSFDPVRFRAVTVWSE